MGAEQKVAIITGASQGLGEAILKGYRDRNWRVVANSRNIKPSTDPDVLTVAGDIGDPEVAERTVKQALGHFGRIDTLVNNAGITRDNLFVQLRDEDWDDVIAVNLTATFRLARAATKLMMRKRFGRIIAITSIVGVTGNPGQGNYTASKAGIIEIGRAHV